MGMHGCGANYHYMTMPFNGVMFCGGGHGCGANYHYMTMPFNGVMFMMMHCSSWRLTV